MWAWVFLCALQKYDFQAISVTHPYMGDMNELRAILTHPQYVIGSLLKVSDQGIHHLENPDRKPYKSSMCQGLDHIRQYMGLFCTSLMDEAGLDRDMLTILATTQVAKQPCLP